MMTVLEMQDIISRIRYRPNWNLYVFYDTERRLIILQLVIREPDCYMPLEPPVEQKGRKWLLSNHMTESEVVMTAFKALLTAEEHEARERFTYRARRIFGPHINVNRLVEVCDDLDAREPA